MVRFYLLVVSDRIFRGEERDRSGRHALKRLTGSGHEVLKLSFAPNSIRDILERVREASELGADAMLIIGGTGLGPRDVSVDALESSGARKVPGFGEIFRMLTFQREGTKAWLSRASAYIHGKTLIFIVPGSVDAVELALVNIILPEIDHAVRMLKGHSHWEDDHRAG